MTNVVCSKRDREENYTNKKRPMHMVYKRKNVHKRREVYEEIYTKRRGVCKRWNVY